MTWAATQVSRSTWARITIPARSCSGFDPRLGGEQMAADSHPRAGRLLITTDGGGSNGWRLRLWKWELQRLADQTGLILTVCHFPPGTSKWNKVEHRLFSPSSRPIGAASHSETTKPFVRLIAGTTTVKGLKVTCRLDHRRYPVGPARSRMKS